MLSAGKIKFSGRLAGAACLLALIAAHALEPTARLTQYAHQSWRFGDAGLLGSPQSITQTMDGYIWVSTANGLFRFDGVRFTEWTPPPGESLPSNSMWYLFGAHDGSLYVGTDRGLVRITNGHVHSYPDSPRWPGPFIEDGQGRVWMGVSGADNEPNALCRVEATNLECLGSKDGLPCSRGLSTAIDAGGSIWLGSTEGVCRWKPGAQPQAELLSSRSHPQSLRSVRSLAIGSDGAAWAGTRSGEAGAGLLHFKDGKWKSYVAHGVDGSKLSVSALLMQRKGPLWIGTADGGVYRLADDHLDHFDTADGLSDHHVLSIFQDREGSMWVVTPKGVDFFRDYAVLSFTSSEGSRADHAIGVAADRKGSVFLGSSNNMVRLRDGNLSVVRDGHGEPLKDIQFLFTDSQGNLRIGANGRLLTLKDERTISDVLGEKGGEGEYVAYITEDLAHDVWAALENVRSRASSLLQIRNDRVVQKYDATAIGRQAINALAPNPKGGLWVGGSAHGVFWFHDGRFEHVNLGDFDGRVENLLQEPDGALWVVTQHGFIRYAGGHARTLTTADGLPCASGVNIQDDGQGSIWFYLHCGVVRLTRIELAAWWQNLSPQVHGRLFSALEGARPNLSEGSPAQTPDGHLWSANDYGFQVIDRYHLPFNSLPPPVMLERFAVNGQDLAPDRDLKLPTHVDQLEIDYTGLSFAIPELVRFRYRLQGHDSKWVDADGRRQAFYNDLRPGRYLFQVIARNNDGIWNTQGAEVRFVISPAWYQTMLFRATFACVLLATGTLAFLYRLHSYATSLKLRFDERLEERTRLARDLHDTLLQTIQGSKMVADDAREHVDNPHLTGRALDRLASWLDRAILEGRAALEALRSSSIETNDLAAALHRAADACASGIAMKVNVSTVGASRELHPIARDEVYRIGYEAIRNACAHSGATKLGIELEYKRKFHLRVHDNGWGAEEEILRTGKTGHFGLTGMRERAVRIGGKLVVTNAPSGGVMVSLLLPGQAIYKDTSRGVRCWFLFGRGRNDKPSDVQ